MIWVFFPPCQGIDLREMNNAGDRLIAALSLVCQFFFFFIFNWQIVNFLNILNDLLANRYKGSHILFK